jgi:hypothetical protein
VRVRLKFITPLPAAGVAVAAADPAPVQPPQLPLHRRPRVNQLGWSRPAPTWAERKLNASRPAMCRSTTPLPRLTISRWETANLAERTSIDARYRTFGSRYWTFRRRHSRLTDIE